MQEWVTLVSATAAGLAAVLAGLNLRLTGRREHLRWVRSALESAFVDFLNAVYRHRGACKHIGQLHRGLPSRRTENEWLLVLRDAHEVMIDCISRIRIMTSNEAAATLERLKSHGDAEEEIIRGGRYDSLAEARESRLAQFHRDRDVLCSILRECDCGDGLAIHAGGFACLELGGMFALRWNTFSGSHTSFTSVRRASWSAV